MGFWLLFVCLFVFLFSLPGEFLTFYYLVVFNIGCEIIFYLTKFFSVKTDKQDLIGNICAFPV